MNRSALMAELYGVRHRKGVLTCILIWSLQIVVFAYGANYLISQTTTSIPADQADAMLASVMPAAASRQVVGSLPLYGGPVMIIAGALLSAGDVKNGVIRTVLSRYPARSLLVAARMATLFIVVAVAILVSVAAAFISSFVLAAIAGGDTSLPSVLSVGRDTAYAVLIGFSWAVFGFTLGIIVRSLAGAISVGLIWSLVVEQALHGLSSLGSKFDAIRAILISGASSVLSSDAGVESMPGGSPPNISVTLAIVILVAWVIVGSGVSAMVLRRRDV